MKKKSKIILISISASIVVVTALLLIVFLVIVPYYQNKQWQEKVKAYYDAKIQTYQQENARYADGEVDVAFIGDSLTDGYDLEKYYPNYVTANRGISGDTTFGVQERLQVSLFDLQPKVVVMLIGANNFRTMLDNYEEILMELKENLPNSEIVLLSLTAMSKEWGKNNEIATYNNVVIKKLAQKYEYTFVDLFTPLYDLETKGLHIDYTTDGGHFTDKGYQAVTSIITPYLQEILGR